MSEGRLDAQAAVLHRARVLHDLAERTAPGHGRTTEELARGAAGAERWSWAGFCAVLGVPAFPAKEAPLVAFVRWRWLAGDSRFTIEGHIAGISAAHDHGADPDHWDAVKAAREALAAEARAAAEAGIPPRGQGQAPPMTVSRLRRIVAACPGDLAGVRDRALLLLGFGTAARRAELAGLPARGVQVSGGGLRVTTAHGRTVTVPPGDHPLVDPVRAWLDWEARACLEPGGPALLRVDRSGRPAGRMSGRAVGERVEACGERAGVPGLGGRSLRSGLAISYTRVPRGYGNAGQGGDERVLGGHIRIVEGFLEDATDGGP
ncbi:site-specific integrase [Actinomadura viridis]|uniref:Integrase n=1 Tax=Actinomadura viridis TaxID=58110 RepID=A0A931DR27_9ACTN|nr:hypothetical protein [Actinomadura viridis]MBG6091830.1 integrase [Actinomadura viridis]